MSNEKELTVHFDENVYAKQAVQRVLANYTDDFYIQIKEDNHEMIALVESKEKEWNPKRLEKELFNRALEETVRLEIEEETKEIRNQLFQNAMK